MRFPTSVVKTLSFVFFIILASVSAEDEYELVERLREMPRGWTRESVASPDALMQFRLAVRHEQPARFERIAMDIATPGNLNYGKHLKKDEIKALFRPAASTTNTVLSWLKSEGIPNDDIEDDGDWINFKASVKQAGRMLNTTFFNYKNEATNNRRIRTFQYSVSREVFPYIQLIQPTTRIGQITAQRNFVTDKKGFSMPDLSRDCQSTVTPNCLRDLYKMGNFKAKHHPRNRLGISGYLQQYAKYSDLKKFLQVYATDLTDATFTVKSINGGANKQHSKADSVEANLDIQYGISLTNRIPTVFYTTAGLAPNVPDSSGLDDSDNTNEPYLEQLHYLLSLTDDELPSVLSTSYGENEQTVPESYANTTCNLFAQLGARGVSVIFSSGDNGVGGGCLTNDGRNRTRFLPTYPATCPFVTSVGGTCETNPERAISFSSGGFSEIFPRPEYQERLVSKYLTALGDRWDGLYNRNGRGFPDVAAQARNFAIVDHGGFKYVDGTR
jgi:tripeptidyl-peptidase I